MKYEFSNREYEIAHGKLPKGTGHWAFTLKGMAVEGIAPESFVETTALSRKDTIFWVPGVLTLSEAKKQATAMLAANGIPTWTTVYIAS